MIRSFMERSAKHFLVIKAARELRKEIEKAGLDDLKTLAAAGVSIVGTYLNGCSAQEKARIKRDLNTLLQWGITPDIVLEEVARQMAELAPIIRENVRYAKGEIEKIQSFLQEG